MKLAAVNLALQLEQQVDNNVWNSDDDGGHAIVDDADLFDFDHAVVDDNGGELLSDDLGELKQQARSLHDKVQSANPHDNGDSGSYHDNLT
jgi:hypothetical protein